MGYGYNIALLRYFLSFNLFDTKRLSEIQNSQRCASCFVHIAGLSQAHGISLELSMGQMAYTTDLCLKTRGV